MSTPLQIVSNQANATADSIAVFFTAPAGGAGVVIESFTASNTSAVNASYKAYIVSLVGTVANPQKPFKIVVWGENDLGSGIVNQFIPPGGTLRMEASAANSIYFTVSGNQV